MDEWGKCKLFHLQTTGGQCSFTIRLLYVFFLQFQKNYNTSNNITIAVLKSVKYT